MISIKKAVLILLLLFNYFIFSANFIVNNPSQFQSALNTASSNGQNDTIIVNSGTYNVNPSLTFSSNENYSLCIRGSGNPVLDGANTRQVLQITTTAPSAVIIVEGLTIQQGRADYGGGLNILTQAAAVYINNCTVNDNTANFVAGGINIFSNTGNISVTGSSFNRNSSPNTSGYPYGNAAGLFIQTDGSGTTIRLSNCTFTSNSSQRDAAGAMLYPLGLNSTVIAETNTFTSNTAKESGGGCWIRGPGGNTSVVYRNNTLNGNSCTIGGNGGGTYIQISSGTIDIYDNIHTGNNSVWQGGGLWIEHSGGILNMFRNRFINNISGESGAGANIFLESGTAKIYQNVFNKNRSNAQGGGLNFSTNTGSINVYNNTFFANSGSDGGDVNFYFDNASARSYFVNNILYGNTLPVLSFSGVQTVSAKYCDIKGGTGEPWFSTGCIEKYPFFRDTAGNDLHLQDSIHCANIRYSPCIDAGSTEINDSTINCSWGLNLNRSDMGAYGGKGNIPIGIINISSEVPEKFCLLQNYPNPFNPYTMIRFTLPFPAKIKFYVTDILGRELIILYEKMLNEGTYEYNFDGSNFSSGVYFYTIETDKYIKTRKMILFK